jgi:hypothetical protein
MFRDPILGSLVYQFLRGVTLEYDLFLGCTIARRKDIDEELHFTGSIMASMVIEVPSHEKMSFRPSKWPRKFRTRKTAKNSKLPKKKF